MASSKRKETIEINSKRNLVTYTHPDSLISDQFRTIQTNLALLTTQGKNRVFLITSPNIGEGKSTMAANLAISMALQKKKVLLIDADLRTPSSHSILRLPNEIGLADVLLDKLPLDEAISKTDIDSLDVLTAGTTPLNPIELFIVPVMQELIKTAEQLYDVVIIDSPAVLEVTDSKILAGLCNGIILVVQRGKTNLQEAWEARKELEFAKGNILGVIMNE